jgi:mRNA-degrading endonuclease toxin of MazEF toxin-antitoxin module
MSSAIRRGDVVQVSWPHADGGTKSRPTLVISTTRFNTERQVLV